MVKYFEELARLFGRIEATDFRRRNIELGGALNGSVNLIKKTAFRGRKLLIIGNGGSASIASHLAIDFWTNSGIKALSFYDGAQLTRLGNDLGFERVFEAPVKAFSEPGDLLIAISSSGRSENILRGVRAARLRKCVVITLSGFRKDNPLRKTGDFNFYVPSGAYGFVETIHAAICHLIADHTCKKRNG
ncbi:MAG TPA: phosphoheptose isomerase [Elusimicrobia bacterium]|nr:phosphoheptose isomerase [Elusimicrobiota bacterium]